MHNVGTVPMFKMHNIGTVPTFKMHNVGTPIFFGIYFVSLNFDCMAKINDRLLPLFFYLSLLGLTTQPLLNHVSIKGGLYWPYNMAIVYKGTV